MDNVQIFDTTLRDGEQSPGFSMNREEKLQLARQIEQLGVDVIEAGFPDCLARRPGGDARRSRRNQGLPCSGARPRAPGRCGCGAARSRTCRQTPPACFSRHFRPAPEIQAADDARAGARTDHENGSLRDGSTAKKWNFRPRMRAAPTLTISARWLWPPWNPGATIINLPDTVGYSTPDDYGEMFRKVRARLGDASEGRAQRALPRRSRPGAGEFARRDRRGRAPDRMHDQRHRRARRKCVARGTGRGAARAPGSLHGEHEAPARKAVPDQPHAFDDYGRFRAAEQGGRGRKCLRARSRHSSGRHSEESADLRNYRSGKSGSARAAPGARKAFRAKCVSFALGGTGIRNHGRRACRVLTGWRWCRRMPRKKSPTAI